MLAAWLLLPAWGCASTDPGQPPGTVLGLFHATARLESNGCGAGVDSPARHEFDLVLSRDAAALYWTQNGFTLVGSAGGDGATWTYGAAALTDGVCTLERQQVFAATLDDAEQPSSLQGTIRHDLTPAAGTSCSGRTTATGGTFDNLPCQVSYVFSAQRQ